MEQNKSLSVQKAADVLPVSKSTIYDLIRRGNPKGIRELSRFSGNDYRDSGKIIQEV